MKHGGKDFFVKICTSCYIQGSDYFTALHSGSGLRRNRPQKAEIQRFKIYKNVQLQ